MSQTPSLQSFTRIFVLLQKKNYDYSQAKEPLKNILEFGLGADSQRSPWERGNDEEASDDNVDREHICDDLIENQGPVVQHAFWKGEGDKNTIRSNQGQEITCFFSSFFRALFFSNNFV